MEHSTLEDSLKLARQSDLSDLPFGFTDEVMDEVREVALRERLMAPLWLAATAAIIVAVGISAFLTWEAGTSVAPPPLTLFQAESLSFPASNAQ